MKSSRANLLYICCILSSSNGRAPYRSCAYPASGLSKVASHSLAALLQPAMGGLQPASGGHHRNGKARKKLLVVLLAESLPIGRVEKDPVKLQVVYGLGADAGRASLDLLKYELLKAEQVFHRANALPTGGQPARKCVCFFTHNGQYFGSNTRFYHLTLWKRYHNTT